MLQNQILADVAHAQWAPSSETGDCSHKSASTCSSHGSIQASEFSHRTGYNSAAGTHGDGIQLPIRWTLEQIFIQTPWVLVVFSLRTDTFELETSERMRRVVATFEVSDP